MRLAKRLVSAADNKPKLPPVTPLAEHEKKILRLLAMGKTSKDVASELGIGMRTLRNHITHINYKLHAHNRLEAVLQALERELI